MNNNFEKSDSLEELEKKLYSPNQNPTQKERKHLRPQEFEVAQNWQSEHVSEKVLPVDDGTPKTNWFLGIFILAFIFFLGALGYVGVKFYLTDGVSAQEVDIIVNAPLTISAGEVLDFEIQLQNRNQIPVKYVDIEVQFPDGTRTTADIGTDYKNSKETVESIAIGEIIKRNYDALLFGEENEKKEISVFLKYSVDGSTLLFKKEKKFDIILKSTPVRLTVTNVKQTTSGQDLDFTIELVSNSTQVLKDVMVQASYPFGFTYKSSSIVSEDDKKTWIIPTLAPKETITFNVKGKIEGQNKDEKFFSFVVGLKDEIKDTPQVVFSTKGTTVTIERPFIEVNFAVNQNNSDTLTLNPEQGHNAIVSFKNNTEYQLRNVSISLHIEGNALAEESIRVSDGFYQSFDNTITWDYTTSDKLISIPVGSSGNVSFNFRSLGLLSQKFLLNPEAVLTINMKGNRNPDSESSDLLEDSVIKKLKFNTEVAISSDSKYYSGSFSNSGPIPPKVEQRTTYTGLITLKNSSNAISEGVVTMKIPNYVLYEGVFSPSGENVSFDSVNRTITWNVGAVSQNTGFIGSTPKTLALQVSLVPSISQVATSPELIKDIKFVGTDTFTGQQIVTTTDHITTSILDSKDYHDATVSK